MALVYRRQMRRIDHIAVFARVRDAAQDVELALSGDAHHGAIQQLLLGSLNIFHAAKKLILVEDEVALVDLLSR